MDNNTEEAVNWAKNRLTILPSLKTQEQYLLVFKRLKLSKQINWSRNKNTRSVERSATRFFISKFIVDNADKNPEKVNSIYAKIKQMKLEADAAQKRYALGKDPETGGKFPNLQLRKSKRSSIRGLGSIWREKLVEISSGSKFADHIRIMSICGCRPQEFENGIELNRDLNTITIVIKGAKCSKLTEAGQPWRALTFDSRHPLIGNIQQGVYTANARGISDAVSHYGKKISSNKKHPISAYSLRHSAASDFKSSGLSDEEIAAALGHRSTATMSLYGSKNSASGMLNLLSVVAAEPVRSKYNNQKAKNKPW